MHRLLFCPIAAREHTCASVCVCVETVGVDRVGPAPLGDSHNHRLSQVVDANDLFEANRRMAALPHSAAFERHQTLLAKSRDHVEITGTTRRKMEEGLGRKLNVPPGSTAVRDRIAEVEARRFQRRASALTEAAELGHVVDDDPAEQRWRRARGVWQRHLAPLYSEFTTTDREIGESRMLQGSKFEEWARQDAFDIVAARLPPPRSGEVVVRRDNWDWVDERGRGVGEVDVIVSARRTLTGTERPLALLELKAHCLDIAGGWWQHSRQQRAGNLLQPTDVEGGLRVEAPETTPIFVISTLPFHSFVLGAQMDIVQRLGKHFGNQYRGTAPKLLPHDRDVAELESIALKLRAEMGLDGHGCESDPRCTLAPLDFLRQDVSNRVLFIV